MKKFEDAAWDVLNGRRGPRKSILTRIKAAWLAVRERRRLRRLVFDNLDAAAQNGYFEQGEQLYGASSRDIAYDMTCFASELENYSPETLLPHVRAWSRNRGVL